MAVALLAVLGSLGLTGGTEWTTMAAADLRPAASLTAPSPPPTLAGPPTAGPSPLLHYRGTMRGSTVVDSSPAGDIGRVLTGRGGRIESTSTGRSNGYLRFPGRDCDPGDDADCAWAVVLSRGRVAAAVQGRAPFTFGAWVRLPRAGGTGTAMTIIQRGGRDGGPAWSLEVDDGRVSCRWADGSTSVVLPDDLGRSFPLEPRRWYALTCSRDDERFVLSVHDPVTTWPLALFRGEQPGVGPIDPTGPVSVGAAAGGDLGTITAPFHGDLDEVVFRTG